MADIRKRTGANGTTYQVRYASPGTKTGYAYATFDTRKEALAFRESGEMKKFRSSGSSEIKTVDAAIRMWLDVCEKEGRDGRDPVTKYTHKTYAYRAEIMRAYEWTKELPEMRASDVIEFRSWLLRNYSRDQAKKVLSSFYSVMHEMALRDQIGSNFATGISVRADSRYDEPVEIPSSEEVAALLAAADRLANSKNLQIAKSWKRYRPMLYLAADSGMRPQEYIVLPNENIVDGGVKVDRALERGDKKISVTKTPAGRRFIDLSPETFGMIQHYAEHAAVMNDHDLVFPTASGRWQSPDNWRKRGFGAACEEAGLVDEVIEDGETTLKPRYTPYSLRHFYASMLIEQKINLKKIQKVMGHSDIKTTMNVYGHIIEKASSKDDDRISMIGFIRENSCGKSVARTSEDIVLQ